MADKKEEMEDLIKKEMKEEKFLMREDYNFDKLMKYIEKKKKEKALRMVRIMGRFERRLERVHQKIGKAIESWGVEKLPQKERMIFESVNAKIKVFDADLVANVSRIGGQLQKIIEKEDWKGAANKVKKLENEIEAWLYLDKELIHLEHEIIEHMDLNTINLIKEPHLGIYKYSKHNVSVLAEDFSRKLKAGLLEWKPGNVGIKAMKDWMKTIPQADWKHTPVGNYEDQSYTSRYTQVTIRNDLDQHAKPIQIITGDREHALSVYQDGTVTPYKSGTISPLKYSDFRGDNMTYKEMKAKGLVREHSYGDNPREGGHLSNVPLSERKGTHWTSRHWA